MQHLDLMSYVPFLEEDIQRLRLCSHRRSIDGGLFYVQVVGGEELTTHGHPAKYYIDIYQLERKI